MSTDQLQNMIQMIDGRAVNLTRLDAYYNGTPPLSFLSPEAREALGNRFGRMGSNFAGLRSPASLNGCGLPASPVTVNQIRRCGLTGPVMTWTNWRAPCTVRR